MANSPNLPASDEFRDRKEDEGRFAAKVPGTPVSDGAATPRDVLVALTYGLDLARHGAMVVADGGPARVTVHCRTQVCAQCTYRPCDSRARARMLAGR